MVGSFVLAGFLCCMSLPLLALDNTLSASSKTVSWGHYGVQKAALRSRAAILFGFRLSRRAGRQTGWWGGESRLRTFLPITMRYTKTRRPRTKARGDTF